jgi:acyl-CoA synthetase (AMP-forming)/AMP-acid ligase II
MNLIDVIAKFARMSARSTAFVEVRPLSGLRQEIRWEEFHDRTNRIANRLIQAGVQKQDKVFLLGRNSIRWLETYFAILKTGAWAVPLNFRFTDETFFMRRCGGALSLYIR